MNCIYCGHSKLYLLKEGNLKCTLCKRKFSPKKEERKKKILKLFLEGENALNASKILKVHYTTVSKKYMEFRKKVAKISEDSFTSKKNLIEYNEYFYTPKNSKKGIYDSNNFITFYYDDLIYNLLMPSMKTARNLTTNKEEEYEKFVKFHRVADIKTKDGVIQDFWQYFEKEIRKFRGVNVNNFPYYLKEIEFRFNYGLEERMKLLKD